MTLLLALPSLQSQSSSHMALGASPRDPRGASNSCGRPSAHRAAKLFCPRMIAKEHPAAAHPANDRPRLAAIL